MSKRQLTPEQIQKRRQNAFRRKILTTFKNVGFSYLSVHGKHRKFGLQEGELDTVFLFKNIIIVCEDTVTERPAKMKSHLKGKKILFDEIDKNPDELIDWLKEIHEDKFSEFAEYDNKRYKIFFLYCVESKFNPADDEIELFRPIKIVEPSTLNYFHKLSQSIKFSSRNEVFRFLGLKRGDIGRADSGSNQKRVEVTIVCPQDSTGHGESGVQLVSFMLSADFLIRNSYVLRKDSWETRTNLYQRLIEKSRVKKIREYVAGKGETFYNNIIVSLPEGVNFYDADNEPLGSSELKAIDDFSGHKIAIPDEFNSICIIDGQHRVFAHYEGNDPLEEAIRPLRDKFHLLVTGLIFPRGCSEVDRLKYESEIFLDINSNSKRVPPDVLLFIETLKNPFSNRGVARKVLEELNKNDPFHNMFQLSLMEESRIKTASIVKFALCNLVAINDTDPATLYRLWNHETGRSLGGSNDLDMLDEYIKFAANKLRIYFSALRSVYPSEWASEESKILSTTSINGFIMALRRSIGVLGFLDYQGYVEAIGRLPINFDKQKFTYTSSQYNKFSIQILKGCFGIVRDDNDNWVVSPATRR